MSTPNANALERVKWLRGYYGTPLGNEHGPTMTEDARELLCAQLDGLASTLEGAPARTREAQELDHASREELEHLLLAAKRVNIKLVTMTRTDMVRHMPSSEEIHDLDRAIVTLALDDSAYEPGTEL